jgi:UDPglucose 6-dehydrogenase
VHLSPDFGTGTRPPGRRITIVGCGHVGLVMAAGFARLGHQVTGIDKDPELVADLDRGVLRVQEDGLPQLISEGVAAGWLRFTTAYEQAIPDAEFIFLAVDTPQTLGGASDLRNLRAAAQSVAVSLNGTGPVVVNKSTSPIGTGDMLETIFSRVTTEGHARPIVVSNPEFLQQGRAVHDFFEPTRIVVGASDPEHARAVAQLYEGLPGEVVLTTRRTAEMIKYVANAFLATRVSFINEIAQLCEAMGVDVDDVVDGVAQDRRIGRQFFVPGIGYGGSCLPKDTASLRFMGEATGVPTPFLGAVQQVNDIARTRTIRRLREALGTLDGKRIAVWGLTFKGDTEDTRQSPATEVVQLLVNEGADVVAYDPSRPTERMLPPRLYIELAASALDAVDGADALAILTDWNEFALVPVEEVVARMRGDLVLDGRNVLDPDAALRAGVRYLGVGRGRTRQLEGVPA